MRQYLGLTIATFLAFFILVSHGLPTTNTYLNKRYSDVTESTSNVVSRVSELDDAGYTGLDTSADNVNEVTDPSVGISAVDNAIDSDVDITDCDLDVTDCDLDVTDCDLDVTDCDLDITDCDLDITD